MDRPWPASTNLSLLTVVDPALTAELPALVVDAHSAAEAILARAAAELRSHGLTVSTSIANGHPATAILETAVHRNADLVMVGSHRGNTAARFLLGSTALHVVRGAPCSAEIVHFRDPRAEEKESTALRILLATDGSECSRIAAKSVAQRPWPAGTEVLVICVPEAIHPWFANEIANPAAWEEILEMRLSQAKDVVEGTRKLFADSSLRVHTAVPKPMLGPKAVILDEADAWQADWIVVGSHGRRGLDKFWMGSVFETIARNARCSVAVIRSKT